MTDVRTADLLEALIREVRTLQLVMLAVHVPGKPGDETEAVREKHRRWLDALRQSESPSL